VIKRIVFDGICLTDADAPTTNFQSNIIAKSIRQTLFLHAKEPFTNDNINDLAIPYVMNWARIGATVGTQWTVMVFPVDVDFDLTTLTWNDIPGGTSSAIAPEHTVGATGAGIISVTNVSPSAGVDGVVWTAINDADVLSNYVQSIPNATNDFYYGLAVVILSTASPNDVFTVSVDYTQAFMYTRPM
jgi:hypothetical protein